MFPWIVSYVRWVLVGRDVLSVLGWVLWFFFVFLEKTGLFFGVCMVLVGCWCGRTVVVVTHLGSRG